MLPIQLSGHGVEITPTLHDYIHKKFDRFQKHAYKITKIHIFLSVNKLSQRAEATIHIPGAEVYASAESEDMYKTIDLLIAKVVRQLDKHKIKNH
ncbi:MAG: ribosome-associated translation inhibitor RaiA [Coxiellaceae bacterium]|jgi:putative sigma-54 modulation protein|nr:ribosome-associated translation inhibitor RaiA [Coxiellaceae bacterium]